MKLSALLLALLLALALVVAPAAVRAQDEESSEDAGAESSAESSEESSAEESSSDDQETASRNVQQVPNVGGGKVTLVSNKNTLTHIASAPKVINHFALEEQERKSQAEQKLKRTDEQAMKKKQEVAEKDAKAKEMKAKAVLESKQKEALREQSAKKLEEQKTKAQIALAKQKAEAQAKLAKTKEAAEKKDKADRHREGKAKAAARAVEQRKKRHHHNRRRAAEQQRKRTQIRLHGWGNYHHSYEHSGVYKWSRYCVATGLLRGGPSLVGYMPSHCRPYHGRLIFALHRGRESRVDVLPDGRIYYITGASANWLSLNGMTFDTHVSHGLQLHHGWRSYGYGYRRVTQSNLGGLCSVSGLIRHGRWGYQGRVMNSCRPHGRLIFSGNNHHHITRLDVRSDQHIVYSGGYHNHHWVSFDGMIYAPYGGGHTMSLYNHWRHYHSGYRRATYYRRGPICVLGGLIRGHWRHHITTLPRGCRPRRRLIFGANVHSHNARVDILPDGRVLYINRASRHGWMSLSGIHFVAYR